MDERNPPGLWLPYSTVEEMHKRQRALIEAKRRHQIEARESAARRAAIAATPCRRCGQTDTSKDGDGFCYRCVDIVALLTVIEAMGGTDQTADALAERLEAAGYSFEVED